MITIKEDNRLLFAEFLFGRLFSGIGVTDSELKIFSGCDAGEVDDLVAGLRSFGLVDEPWESYYPPEWRTYSKYTFNNVNDVDTSRLGKFIGLDDSETTACVVKVQNQIETFLRGHKERK